MAKITMLVGVAGSGKSTYAEELKKQGAVVVSSDAIRGEMWGDENEQKDPQKVFQECHRRIKANLRAGKWVVFDATNLSARRRESFLRDIGKLADCKECVVFITPPDIIMYRMKTRERKVPVEVIYKQLCGFQCPLEYEGWDYIRVKWDDTCVYESMGDYILECYRTPNDNKNHSTDTVADHIDASSLYFAVNYGYRKDVEVDLIVEALKYHDIGKPQTKVFCNSKGEPTKDAHYYGHQNYSAYIYLMTAFNTVAEKGDVDRVCKIANLIQFHMEHFFRSPESLEKFYKKTGLGRELAIIHKCDMAGH